MTAPADGFYSTDSLAHAADGDWAAQPPATLTNTPVVGVCTDTRQDCAGRLFIALRGERHDGHDHLDEAQRAGARAAMVDRRSRTQLSSHQGLPLLVVDDTRRALGRLAGAYRLWLGQRQPPHAQTTVIAVTGSNGKTTTVRLIDAALRTALPGIASIKSYNNDIGVPLTLLAATPEHRYIICEAGMNAPGELAYLTSIIRPNIAVVTSIGRAHIEAFGSVDAIAQEKLSLLAGLQPDGVAVVPVAWADAAKRSAPADATLITVGDQPGADLRPTDIHSPDDRDPPGCAFTLDGTGYRVPLLGEHHATNAACAVAVARTLGVDNSDIAAGLASAEPPPMRGIIEQLHGVTLFNDAYNASPESVAAAVRTFKACTPGGGRRVVFLGAMRELGDHTENAHREAGLMIARELASDLLLIGVGPETRHTIEEAVKSGGLARERTRYFGSMDSRHAEHAADLLAPGDAVLLKGSRSVGLERVRSVLIERAAHEAAGNTPTA